MEHKNDLIKFVCSKEDHNYIMVQEIICHNIIMVN